MEQTQRSRPWTQNSAFARSTYEEICDDTTMKKDVHVVKMLLVVTAVLVLAACGQSGSQMTPALVSSLSASVANPGPPATAVAGPILSNSPILLTYSIANTSDLTITVNASLSFGSLIRQITLTDSSGTVHNFGNVKDPAGLGSPLVFLPHEIKSENAGHSINNQDTFMFSLPPGDYTVTVFCAWPSVPNAVLLIHILGPVA